MPEADHPIQCQCGKLRGTLSRSAAFTRLRCYCRDCQAYARALGKPAEIVDPQGGSDIVATLQQHVAFSQGKEQLACLSLSEQGLLRWYARCCNTPIGNTARDVKMCYIGLMHSALSSAPVTLDAAFGNAAIAVNAKSARGAVTESGIRTVLATVRIIGRVLQSRFSGAYRASPFFSYPDGRPVADPRVLDAAERQRAFDTA
ncbi:DUF6151 family protein [Tahibacter amnicola]|uniref:DUF6151 family protein n=1 Tax=Tahibacter amnicola TaxID=2976241 RepID=A0ABY6BJ84_9GAMM|nr:DUF6151 family protein [Tahibacter amnicola]UXI70071.1 DUF6151 family protein [Tahibacter amnicola]